MSYCHKRKCMLYNCAISRYSFMNNRRRTGSSGLIQLPTDTVLTGMRFFDLRVNVGVITILLTANVRTNTGI